MSESPPISDKEQNFEAPRTGEETIYQEVTELPQSDEISLPSDFEQELLNIPDRPPYSDFRMVAEMGKQFLEDQANAAAEFIYQNRETFAAIGSVLMAVGFASMLSAFSNENNKSSQALNILGAIGIMIAFNKLFKSLENASQHG